MVYDTCSGSRPSHSIALGPVMALVIPDRISSLGPVWLGLRFVARHPMAEAGVLKLRSLCFGPQAVTNCNTVATSIQNKVN